MRGLCPRAPRIYRFRARMARGAGRLCAALAIPAPESALRVAVGMIITAHPPHRSVRAELPHTAPPLDTSVEACVGIWVKSAGTRNPPVRR